MWCDRLVKAVTLFFSLSIISIGHHQIPLSWQFCYLPYLLAHFLSSTWSSMLPYGIAAPLVVQLMGGMVTNLVMYIFCFYVLILRLLTSHRRHQRYRRDVRFGMYTSTYLHVKLTGYNQC